MSMSMPTEIFSINIKKGDEKQLTNVNTEKLESITLGEVKERWVKTTDGKDMLTWVIYPPEFDATKKYPTLLYCQGGPQSAVSQFFSYRWNFQMMAANGYIVVAPNRRGLPTFGSEWNDQISLDYGGQNMKDYLSAIDDVAKEDYVDADRLGAVGASYGGFSVYWLAGNHDKRFKAFIAHCGMFNFQSWYATTEEMFFANHDLGGGYWEKERPKSYDHHNFVGNWDTPILVIHGGNDFRIPIPKECGLLMQHNFKVFLVNISPKKTTLLQNHKMPLFGKRIFQMAKRIFKKIIIENEKYRIFFTFIILNLFAINNLTAGWIIVEKSLPHKDFPPMTLFMCKTTK